MNTYICNFQHPYKKEINQNVKVVSDSPRTLVVNSLVKEEEWGDQGHTSESLLRHSAT
jgi:hypothetical protein